VHLQVSNLKRSLHFYETLVGMKRALDLGGTVALSASGQRPYHIVLTERPDARPKPAQSTGLYHVAIRFPNRRELAKVFYRLHRNKAAFQGFSDHLVSEAIYLSDPDENGVELYADRPKKDWLIHDNEVQMATQPLNIDDLVGELSEEDMHATTVDPKTDIGHVHLHVSDLKTSENFYGELLGFDVTQRSYPGALFLSAGGYHHHIGVNVWAGRGAPPPPPEAAGLLSTGIYIPIQEAMTALERRFQEKEVQFQIKQNDRLGGRILRVNSPDGMAIEFFTKEQE
jgi:catechol 2,3-dioxygenase